MNIEIKFDPEGHDNGVLDTLEDELTLPTRLSTKKSLLQSGEVKNGWDFMEHSFWNTDEYRKIRGIIHNSEGSSIQQIVKKLKPLIPKQEDLETFLSWNYVFKREDGSFVDRQGRIDNWRNHNCLCVRLDGFIFRLPPRKKRKKVLQTATELKRLRQKAKMEKKENELAKSNYADYRLYLDNRIRKQKEKESKV